MQQQCGFEPVYCMQTLIDLRVLLRMCYASSGFVHVDELVLDLFEKARKAKYPVTRAAIVYFGRAAKKPLLDGKKVSGG